MKIVSKSFLPRFQALGTDSEGRTYYALSPGVAEREAAFEYLEVASSDKPLKPKKKGRTLSEEDRSEMREWPWFVAVWGTRPPLTAEEQKAKEEEEKARALLVDSDEDEDDSSDEDSSLNDDMADEDVGVEKWWGFWEPEEIVKVAEWIAIKSGLDEDVQISDRQIVGSGAPLTPRLEQIKRLVIELKDYAALLQWRIRDDKSNFVSRFSVSGSMNSIPNKQHSSSEVIPAARFYRQ